MLNQTLVGLSKELCDTRAQTHLAGSRDCWSKVLRLGWCPYFFFGSLQEYSHIKDMREHGNIGVQTSTQMSHASDLCGCCPQQRRPTDTFSRTNFCPTSISLDCFVLRPPQNPHDQKLNWMPPSSTTGSLVWLQDMTSWDSIFPLLGVLTTITFIQSKEVPLHLVFMLSPNSSHLSP